MHRWVGEHKKDEGEDKMGNQGMGDVIPISLRLESEFSWPLLVLFFFISLYTLLIV